MNPDGRMAAMYGINFMFGDGLLVFNTCQALDWMLIKNAKLVDKSNYLSRILKNFGGSTYVFAKNSSE